MDTLDTMRLFELLLTGVGASIVTFFLSAIFYGLRSKGERKLNTRSIVEVQDQMVKYNLDVDPISASRIIPTPEYEENLVRMKQTSPAIKIPFARVTNHGPGIILRADIGIRVVLTKDNENELKSWRHDVSTSVIKVGESIYIPLMNSEYYEVEYRIANCDIDYISQSNEKLRHEYICMKKSDRLEILVRMRRRIWGKYVSFHRFRGDSNRWFVFYKSK
ncbi:hypothetical protein [Geomicrobium sediminis]|uniref:Uncharacterized protein n=1 Tax=Geomicrobium sediminis TaxID=1347788 RepID=A0ABS2P9J5_9BACL|nr:hypothetical protein [Geomicrobium sediminis]MBM7631750.1 hypothetical protein [Geomicrobium sediminis]